jgi:hypothetical protein
MALSQDFGTGSLALREVFCYKGIDCSRRPRIGLYDRRTTIRARRIMRVVFFRLLPCGMRRDGTQSPASALR